MHRRDLLKKLPSCGRARALVHALVSSKEKLVVATRSVSEWGFAGPVTSKNLVAPPKLFLAYPHHSVFQAPAVLQFCSAYPESRMGSNKWFQAMVLALRARPAPEPRR